MIEINNIAFQYFYSDYESRVGSSLVYGARFYDATINRFTRVDPLADSPANIGTNSYANVWNNPLKFIDPDGRHGESVDDTGVCNLNGEYQYTIKDDLPDEAHFVSQEMADAVKGTGRSALIRGSSKYYIGENTRSQVSDINLVSNREQKERAFLLGTSGNSKELQVVDITSDASRSGSNINMSEAYNNADTGDLNIVASGHTHPTGKGESVASFPSPMFRGSMRDYAPIMDNQYTGQYGGNPAIIGSNKGMTIYSTIQLGESVRVGKGFARRKTVVGKTNQLVNY